jgi:hypothetical protein
MKTDYTTAAAAAERKKQRAQTSRAQTNAIDEE